MIIFTPNTVIKSADMNLNFSETVNKRAIMTLNFSSSPTTQNYAVTWAFYKVAFNNVQSSYDPAGLLSLSDNGIKIGTGISYVKVSGVFAWYNNGGEADMQTAIYKNSTSIGGQSYFNGPTSIDYMTMPTVQTTVAVAPNDILYMYTALGGTGSRNVFGWTSLTVEVLA